MFNSAQVFHTVPTTANNTSLSEREPKEQINLVELRVKYPVNDTLRMKEKKRRPEEEVAPTPS